MVDGLSAPTNPKGIAKLLGHVGWYRELIPGYANIALPITKLLRTDVRFEWTEACQHVFDELRGKLSTYPILRPPRWDLPFHVFCDANAIVVESAFENALFSPFIFIF